MTRARIADHRHMSGNSQERRKTLVVNKPMQARLILGMALMPALALAAIAIVTAYWCSNTMAEASANDAELPNLSPVFFLVVVFELVAAVYLMVNSLKVSHRVAGPAYRICKSLERIRSGDLNFKVNLRPGDHLTEIRDELNLLLDWLNTKPPAGCVTRKQPTETAALPHETEQATLAIEAVIAATTAAAEAEMAIAATSNRDDDSA